MENKSQMYDTFEGLLNHMSVISVISRLSEQRSKIKLETGISKDGAKWLHKVLTNKIEEVMREYKINSKGL